MVRIHQCLQTAQSRHRQTVFMSRSYRRRPQRSPTYRQPVHRKHFHHRLAMDLLDHKVRTRLALTGSLMIGDRSPCGWERRLDNASRVYYVDHNTRSTTWQRPDNNVTSGERAREQSQRTELERVRHNNRSLPEDRPQTSQGQAQGVQGDNGSSSTSVELIEYTQRITIQR